MKKNSAIVAGRLSRWLSAHFFCTAFALIVGLWLWQTKDLSLSVTHKTLIVYLVYVSTLIFLYVTATGMVTSKGGSLNWGVVWGALALVVLMQIGAALLLFLGLKPFVHFAVTVKFIEIVVVIQQTILYGILERREKKQS